jgi:hypothetical protein
MSSIIQLEESLLAFFCYSISFPHLHFPSGLMHIYSFKAGISTKFQDIQKKKPQILVTTFFSFIYCKPFLYHILPTLVIFTFISKLKFVKPLLTFAVQFTQQFAKPRPETIC